MSAEHTTPAGIAGQSAVQAWTYLQERSAPPVESGGTGVRRQHDRRPCTGCLPLQLRILDQEGAPLSGWYHADPLDFSQGGCCLMLPMDDALPFDPRMSPDQPMPLELAVSPAAGFAQPQFRASLRWFVHSGLVTILGIAFDEPLEQLPPNLFGSV